MRALSPGRESRTIKGQTKSGQVLRVEGSGHLQGLQRPRGRFQRQSVFYSLSLSCTCQLSYSKFHPPSSLSFIQFNMVHSLDSRYQLFSLLIPFSSSSFSCPFHLQFSLFPSFFNGPTSYSLCNNV